MPSSIQEAFVKALSKTQTHATQPIPAEWDDETTETTITEVQTKEPTMQTQTTDKDPKRRYFQPTNNVTRATFDYVRDNPGLPRARVTDLLSKQGFNYKSVSSLLGQMIMQGMIRNNNDALFVTQAEYTPIKARLVKPAKPVVKEVVAKPKRKYERKAKPAAVQVEPKAQRVASTNTLLAEEFDAEKFIEPMTLKQAKAVYDALRKIFG